MDNVVKLCKYLAAIFIAVAIIVVCYTGVQFSAYNVNVAAYHIDRVELTVNVN